MEIQLSPSAHYIMGLVPRVSSSSIPTGSSLSTSPNCLDLASDPDMLCKILLYDPFRKKKKKSLTNWCRTDNIHPKVISHICIELYSSVWKNLSFVFFTPLWLKCKKKNKITTAHLCVYLLHHEECHFKFCFMMRMLWSTRLDLLVIEKTWASA